MKAGYAMRRGHVLHPDLFSFRFALTASPQPSFEAFSEPATAPLSAWPLLPVRAAGLARATLGARQRGTTEGESRVQES